jgi:hypothetical protein
MTAVRPVSRMGIGVSDMVDLVIDLDTKRTVPLARSYSPLIYMHVTSSKQTISKHGGLSLALEPHVIRHGDSGFPPYP